jgi:hypothetical protein
MCSRSRQCPRLVTASNLVFCKKILGTIEEGGESRGVEGGERRGVGLEDFKRKAERGEELKAERGEELDLERGIGLARVQGLEHANKMPKGPSGGPSQGET